MNAVFDFKAMSQVPWQALRTKPVVVELSGVRICVTLRDESEFEEGPAKKRRSAAKVAKLKAADLETLSKRLAVEKTGGAPTENRSFWWSFMSQLIAMLLNRLQLTLSDVQLCFKVQYLALSVPYN